jgi:polysaccharide export outer membrane protein
VSSLNPEFNVLFNAGVLMPEGTTNNAITDNKISQGYLVDKNGEIIFPVIGKIMLGGFTKQEAIDKITSLLQEHVKNPIVNIRFLNFKVTVIGEVNNPSTFNVPSESINILEALGFAGDMTVFGRRENVLIIREQDGIRSSIRVNLNQKDLISSPYFYLQKNDIVYVEPHNRRKLAQADPNTRFIPIIVSAISALAIFLTTVNR